MVKKKFNPLNLLTLVGRRTIYTPSFDGPSDVKRKQVNENTVEYRASGQILVRAKTFLETREVEFYWKFLTPNKKCQRMDIQYSRKPLVRDDFSTGLALLRDLRANVSEEEFTVHTLVDDDALSERTLRHQFPDGGKVYFRIAAEGDRWNEVIIHDVQFSKGAVAPKAQTLEQQAEDIVRHMRDHLNYRVRGLVEIEAASAEAEAKVKLLGLPPSQERVVLGELRKEKEELIRRFRLK